MPIGAPSVPLFFGLAAQQAGRSEGHNAVMTASLPPEPLRADLCPLCGQPNECGACQGNASACWCMSTPIGADVLARLPAEERGLRCICARCAQKQPQVDAQIDPSEAPG
ncbi:cysteine-rich CWC family protein [Curvibacter lanceolatus]|uniref:cysteine-rich CWC family protein n=2 Tax=Curvibacter lanceolatus TaxID=86182 RepID=UPI0030811445